MEGELFAANVECIKRICAVGAVLEKVFFTLGKFFAAFVFPKSVAAAAYAGCLNGEDKVVVVLSVEERHKALLSGKTLVDEKVFLIVPHGIAEIDRLDGPAMAFKLVDYYPTVIRWAQTKGTVLLVCWYAFVAISKQCVNAFEICQGHLPI